MYVITRHRGPIIAPLNAGPDGHWEGLPEQGVEPSLTLSKLRRLYCASVPDVLDMARRDFVLEEASYAKHFTEARD
ncbi:hypothetical protein SAMD00023353_6400380 [Rosellinia necatrix]|uniref:Uncharacterized protein n=1 Tax=Rosellinia necatrix TaxID=77044 RepID=A0A1S8ABH7_ROSNE|nr:hypothetical protein SAMD00023353_6400380 [Rosellinia necatrix]